MADLGWRELFAALRHQQATVAGWTPEPPNPDAELCEQSLHRTLGHLRACQEMWLLTAQAFIRNPGVSVNVPHPWRTFDKFHYAKVPWEVHMERYLADREIWLALEETTSPEIGGRWNKRNDTVLGLTRRLAEHENYHILLLEQAKANLDKPDTNEAE